MEKLQQCVLVFCIACIVSGLLERISTTRRRFPVIKLVCALYIVSAVFVPIRELRTGAPDTAFQEAPTAVSGPDARQLALGMAEKELSDTVADALAAAGIECRAVHVQLTQQEKAVAAGVTVTLPAGGQEDGVAQVIARVLGAPVPVDVQWEGK